MITIYKAAKIHTLNPSNPTADHIAVDSSGMILGVGTYEETASWGEHQLDESFSEKVNVSYDC